MTRQNPTRPLREPSLVLQLRYACRLVCALTRVAWLPVLFFIQRVRLLEALGRAVICGMFRICFALLVLAILANVTFGLARTLFHPWFAP